MCNTLLLLTIFPFICTVYSMQQQNSELLKWDINGSAFKNYASNFRPKEATSCQKACRLIQAPDNNNVIQHVTEPAIDDEKITELMNAYRSRKKYSTSKVQFFQNMSSQFHLTHDQEKLFLTKILNYEFSLLRSSNNAQAINNFFGRFSHYFPINTFSWNANGDKVLHIAVTKRSIQLAKYLVQQQKADCNVLNNQQQTPLEVLEGLKLEGSIYNSTYYKLKNLLQTKVP